MMGWAQCELIPGRSNEDAALLEWGSSAIIHNADGVVARFGPSAKHPEFELGIEAELVTASPRQGCEALSNARQAATQIVVMYRGGCAFGVKAAHASAAGAAAMLVVNSDRRSPDRAFAMASEAKGEVADDGERESTASVPSVMISYAAGQQLRDHRPPRMRVFAGGGRPFIESVTDNAPVLYLVHNAMTEGEMAAARRALEPSLATASDDLERVHRVLGALRGSELSSFYDRLASIVGYPVEHLGDLALERRARGAYAPRDERRLSRFNADLGDDARGQTVLSVYVYLDDAPADGGGELYFPRARPAPTKILPRKGLAAVFYSSLEDGSLDPTAAHGDGPLPPGASLAVLHLRVYAAPRTLARRLVLPLLLAPLNGAPSKTLVYAAKRFFARAFGPDHAAENGVDLALYLLALALLAPFAFLAVAAFKAYERSKAPPKRKSTHHHHHHADKPADAKSDAGKGGAAARKHPNAAAKKFN